MGVVGVARSTEVAAEEAAVASGAGEAGAAAGAGGVL